MNNRYLYELNAVSKEFIGPSEKIRILNGINLAITQGESLAILGASGSGKTTLLHLLGSLDVVSQGSIFFHGKDLAHMTTKERARLRNQDIGFVFQFHHLLPEFTALENVAMPARIAGNRKQESLQMAEEAIGQVGLSERMHHQVTTLSGGERQRAAIARAILLKPRVLLADEPTGNLDEKTGEKTGQLLIELNRELGMSLIVVTHNRKLAGQMDKRLELRAGELYAID